MPDQKESVKNCTFEELTMELKARANYQALSKFNGTGVIPGMEEPDKALISIDTGDLIEELKSRSFDAVILLSTFGDLDLEDWDEIEEGPVKKNAECVVAIFNKEDVKDNEDGFSTLITRPYAQGYLLCPLEPFSNQPIANLYFFTGFLVREDIIATAGHCVDEGDLEDLRIVFGFKNSDLNPEKITRVDNINIYNGKSIIAKQKDPDWALIKLDRSVENQEIAKLSESPINYNQEVYAIGHPFGLPLKYAPGAKVCDNIPGTYFKANLDAYTRSSGSPVFNCTTHKVEGVVVQSEGDFEKCPLGRCRVLRSLPDDCSKGATKCTRVSEFIDKL